MSDLLQQRKELQEEINKRNYQSLRYSILGEKRPGEWEVRIDYDKKMGKYFVYKTMDQASIMGKYEYSDFNSAKERFLAILDSTVQSSRRKVLRGELPNYFSPLWDQVKSITLNSKVIDSIGIVNNNLELLLIDDNLWNSDTEHDHLLKLQEKINNYIHFLESKQYVEKYGDNFKEKVIHVTFQYAPSDNGLAFLVQVQKVLQSTDMSLKVTLPD